MNRNVIMLKLKKTYKCIVFISVFLLSSHAFSQAPQINFIDRGRGPVGLIITISGTGFSSNINENIVYFGAMKGRVIYAAPNLLEVRVPPGTTNSNVSVTNTTNNLTGYSSRDFYLSFIGTGFDPTAFSTQLDLPANNGVADLCMCDFDGNGKTDIGIANEEENFISVYENNSAIASISYSKINLAIGTFTNKTICRDLDGDGRPELLATQFGTSATKVFIFRNTSTIGNVSFSSTRTELTIVGNNTQEIAVNDIDKDGKPEIVVANLSNNLISIFKNNSTAGSLNFSTPTTIEVGPVGEFTTSVSLEDLNGDARPELIASNFGTSSITVFENQSSPGNIQFGAFVKIPNASDNRSMVIGDLNGDGKNDIVSANFFGNEVTIILNQSTDAGISFSAAARKSTINRPWSIALGDLDGDRLLDIGVAFNAVNSLVMLRNTGSDFIAYDLALNERTKSIRIGDVNGDAKPDICLASITSNKLSILRNLNCVQAAIFPSDAQTICAGASRRLQATPALGVTYSWTKDNVAIVNNSSFLNVTAGGSYSVTITGDGGACVSTSAPVAITSIGGTAPTTPNASSNPSSACLGATLTLMTSSVAGATYEWGGPNAYTSTDQNPVITNFTTDMVGRYYVKTIVSGCISAADTVIVSISEVPDLTILSSNGAALCNSGSTTLSVPNSPALGYQWLRDGTNISSAATASYPASQAGSYTVSVKNSNGCEAITDPFVLSVVSPPTVAFTAPTSGCLNFDVPFSNTTVIPPDLVGSYLWDFGDGDTSTEENPSHTYTSINTFTVELTVDYVGLSCPATSSSTITIVDGGTVDITPSSTTACEGEPVTLSLSGSFNTISWSTGETTQDIIVTTSGTYSAVVKTTDGCTLTVEEIYASAGGPQISVDPTSAEIEAGGSIQLTASGADVYRWEPSEGLSDANIANPIASPGISTIYQVIGEDINGCTDTLRVNITVGALTTIDVDPIKAFSPNGDSFNPVWTIEGIQNYPDCEVIIFTDRGIEVFRAQPYLSNWDGTQNGSPLKSGAYYYVIRCGTDENLKSGSIALMR